MQKPVAQDPDPWPPRTPDDDNGDGGGGYCDFDGDCGGGDSLVRPRTPREIGASDGIEKKGPDEKEDERRAEE